MVAWKEACKRPQLLEGEGGVMALTLGLHLF
jgi:hypothetical protein